MKYLKKFNLFESIEEAVEELKEFQNDLDINSNIDRLLKSIDAVELDIKTIFPFFNGSEDIVGLEDNPEFVKEIEDRNLRLSELFDTNDSATLIKLQLRYYWIYTEESTDLEMPVYIMLQWVNNDKKLSNIHLYYVQSDIENFYTELSSVTMIIKQKAKKSNKWIYISSNSGRNWVLQNIEDVTTTFKKNLNNDDVEEIAKHPDVEVTFS